MFVRFNKNNNLKSHFRNVCTECTNLIKVDVDVDVNEMSPLNI